jgi:hypothetical protein
MNNYRKQMAALTAGVLAVGGLVSTAAAGILSDDFSGGLGSWSSTVMLDNGGSTTNTYNWQVNGSGQLELDTTAYDNIEQSAFIRSGASLEIGEEAQVTMSVPISGNRNLGLYVGGTAPATGVRQDYITVYGESGESTVSSRGFDGTTEYNNPNIDVTSADTLFITRTAHNTYEVGFYEGETRTVVTTRTPATPNSGDYVGIYADVRAAGTVGAIDGFQIIEVDIDPVTADIDASTLSGLAPLEVVFSGENSTAIESIASYTWDFGDGNTAAGSVVTNTFTAIGTYTVELTVVDTLSNSNSATVEISATAEPVESVTVLMDDFSGSLTNYTMTRILNNSGGLNDLAGVINTQALDFAATYHTGAADQYAYIYDGLSLNVGDEIKCDISWFKTMTGSDSSAVGLYVGKPPEEDVREDYICVYLNGSTDGVEDIKTRGFDGSSEFNNVTDDLNVTALFIARIGENTYETGSYDGETRNVLTTRSEVNAANDGSAVGFYIDTRGTGTIGTLDNLSLVTEPSIIGDVSIDVVSDGTQVTLSFLTSENASYGVAVSSDLTDSNWNNIITNIPGTGGEVTVTNPVASAAEFYRAYIEE